MTEGGDFFPFRFDGRFALFWIPFGVRRRRDGVRLSDSTLRARFGFLTLETPIANLSGAHVTRNYRWWTAMGARLSLRDDGLTFGTNPDTGVCIHFIAKVPSALRRRGHSALTVTVADPDGLVDLIQMVTSGK